MRSDFKWRPERDATYANTICAAAEQEPPRAPREPVRLTVIDLGVNLGSTTCFTDASELRAMVDSGASSACMCRLSARPPATVGGARALRGPAAPDVRRPAAEYFGQEVSSDYCTAMPPSFPHKLNLLLNVCDSYSKEKVVFFTLGKSQVEIGSALRAYCRERVDSLK